LRRRAPRQLVELGSTADVVKTGAVGFLDAADEERRRWISRFRSLLDGPDSPLQVMIRFSPGHDGCDRAPDSSVPEPSAGRRAAGVLEYLQRQLIHVRASVQQSTGSADPEVAGAMPSARALQARLTAGQESAFHVSLYLTATASTRVELEAAADLVESAART